MGAKLMNDAEFINGWIKLIKQQLIFNAEKRKAKKNQRWNHRYIPHTKLGGLNERNR